MIIDLAEIRNSGTPSPSACASTDFEAEPIPADYPSRTLFSGLFSTSQIAAELVRMDKATAARKLASAGGPLNEFIEDLELAQSQAEVLAAILRAAHARIAIIAIEGENG
ncbi:MAG: hypothetical protein AAGC92_16405 [Pseudomonadota bacterium]